METDIKENQPSISVWDWESEKTTCHFYIVSFEIGINYVYNVRRNVLFHYCNINQSAKYEFKNS